jgi:transposase
MFCLNESLHYWLWSEATDMRKSFHSLAGIVTNKMGQNPTSGDVFVFINKSKNRIKLLHWEPGGMVLYSKILESGTFGAPASISPDGSMAWYELVMMVEGIMENPGGRRQRLESLKQFRK